VYYNKLPGGEYINLLLYVDDMFIAYKGRSAIDKLNDLSSEIEMKDLGEEKVLGMEIERDRKGGKVSLGVLKKVLQKFNINDDTKSVSTPLVSYFKLKDTMSLTTIKKREYMTHVPYDNVVGSLMYAMVCTRPDLSQDVLMVSSYMHDPCKGYWEAVKSTSKVP